MLFTSTIWTYCFHQPDITNRVCLLAPFIMQYLGLLHFCSSNKELPTWPTLKGQFFICIKWDHLVPVLRLTVEVIKNCRHGRRSKAKFYLYQMRSSGACFASNCTSNKELPTWPTLKGQFFICIKWDHPVPALRLNDSATTVSVKALCLFFTHNK